MKKKKDSLFDFIAQRPLRKGSGFFQQMNADKKKIMEEKRKRASAKRKASKGKTWHTTRPNID
jgi:hypothetical protein